MEFGENQTDSRTNVLAKMYVLLVSSWKENHPAKSNEYEILLGHSRLNCLQRKKLREPRVVHEYN